MKKEPMADWEKDTRKFITQFIRSSDCPKDCEACEEDLDGIMGHIRSLLASNTKQVEERVRIEERLRTCEILHEIYMKTNDRNMLKMLETIQSRIINSK